jgi:glutamine amidotransferase
MIGIVDYGMGNLFSVSKALERLGVDAFISENPDELGNAKGLILPGVGSFRDAMTLLREKKLDVFLKEYVETGKPLLGICLGMQLLFDESEENGLTQGLSFLSGRVIRFLGITESGETYKVPHMGWNRLSYKTQNPILQNVEENHVYFVHSYYVTSEDQEVILATAEYDVEVPAIVGRNNVYGMQFHPEKSGETGMRLLQNFLKLVG